MAVQRRVREQRSPRPSKGTCCIRNLKKGLQGILVMQCTRMYMVFHESWFKSLDQCFGKSLRAMMGQLGIFGVILYSRFKIQSDYQLLGFYFHFTKGHFFRMLRVHQVLHPHQANSARSHYGHIFRKGRTEETASALLVQAEPKKDLRRVILALATWPFSSFFRVDSVPDTNSSIAVEDWPISGKESFRLFWRQRRLGKFLRFSGKNFVVNFTVQQI